MTKFFQDALEKCIERGIKVKIIGNRSYFNDSTLKMIENVERATEHCNILNLNIAFSYGGRDEIIRAIKKLGDDILAKKISTDDISEEIFAQYLDTNGCPDFDMVIRTGGYHRLSNFFPWQTVYSEILFIDTLWPDFTKEMFINSLQYYKNVKINNGK